MLNPAFMYAITWIFILIIYSLHLSDLLEPLQTSTVILVIGSSLSFIFGWLFESLQNQRRLAKLVLNQLVISKIISTKRVQQRLKMIWIIFSVGIFLEIIYFGGAPGLGLIGIGKNIIYTDFGIPGIHGILNSMFYACCAVQFSKILLGLSKKTTLLTLASILYPIIGMSRQVLISLLLQYLFIYFSIKRPSPLIFIKTVIIFTTVFLIFGYLGDIRSGRENIISLAAPTFEYPEWLPSAFIWFYIYLSTPLNNVNFNIEITPNILPLETAGTFIPSFAREAFLNAVGASRQWDLVTESFNVSSLLQSLLTDFGVYGTIIFTFICGFIFTLFMRRSRTKPVAFFAVIVFLHGIALSFFANLLFHLVFMFEIIIISWIFRHKKIL